MARGTNSQANLTKYQHLMLSGKVSYFILPDDASRIMPCAFLIAAAAGAFGAASTSAFGAPAQVCPVAPAHVPFKTN
jgi:hypothetical protein